MKVDQPVGNENKNPTNPKKIDPKYLLCIVMQSTMQIAYRARVVPYFWAAMYGSSTHVNTVLFVCSKR